MKVTWLYGGGLLFACEDVKILVDPLFSDIPGKERRHAPDMSYMDSKPDVLIITSSVCDRFDKESVKKIIERGGVEVLACEGAYSSVCDLDLSSEPVLLSAHTVLSVRGVTIYSVKAESRDRTAIGVIIDDGDKTYYVSGSTLYNYDVLDDVLDLAPDGVDYAFLPISGRGCNMNAKDAADFAYEIGAKHAVPVDFGLYDDTPASDFDFEDAVLLEAYREYEL